MESLTCSADVAHNVTSYIADTLVLEFNLEYETKLRFYWVQTGFI